MKKDINDLENSEKADLGKKIFFASSQFEKIFR